MADLDDFFAKKDRKKSKSVKKFATTDELAKKLEDTKQKSDVRPKKERSAQEGEEGGRGVDEEEWKEYEEPVKDYTGLKIQVLQGGTGAPGNSANDSSGAEDYTPDGNKPKGPWNKPHQVVETVEPPRPAPAPAPVVDKPYAPPQSRTIEPLRRSHAASRHAPDIHNDDYFPVLGASGKRAGGWSTTGASGAAGAGAARAHARQPLALGNRFTALPDDS